jgi:hypothetical protein
MSADILISRLESVKRTGPSRWIARCPAHDDRSPSLSVRELDDGRVLVHDFAGCAVEEILASVGLTFDALYPERAVGDHVQRERRSFNAHDVLACIAHEALIVALLAADMHKKRSVSDVDYERLMTASTRLSAAAEMGGRS